MEVTVDKKDKVKVNTLVFEGNEVMTDFECGWAMKKTNALGKIYNFFRTKKFIPEKYQEVMKNQGLTIEPKQGEVTEYSKKIKIKDGLEITVDIAELPVLVVYVNEAGKPSEALFMPI